MDLWEAVRVRRFSGRIRNRFLAGFARGLSESGLHPDEVARLVRHARWERVAELKPQDREEEHGLN